MAITSIGFADVTVIESFENTGDPAGWTVTTTADQTHNAETSASVPNFVSTHVTEGVLAGEFNATWVTSNNAALNPYEVGGPLQFWAVRYNVLAPGSLPNNSIPTASGVLEASVYNSSNHTVSVALVVDSIASSQLERGPLVPVPPNTSINYTWNFATTPPVGFVTGDGAFAGTAQRLKSLLVYTTDPLAAGASMSVTVDNIRNTNSPDVTAPAAPRLQAVKQGSGIGNVSVRWAASPDADVSSYKVYVSNDSQFGSPIVNRLQFPATPVATVAAAQLETVLNGLPVNQNIYVAVTAVDNAANANESARSQAFAVNLKPDGAQPLDRIVMDQDRYLPGSAGFETEGYFHAAVYTAQALGSLGRTFDSVSDEALTANLETLTPSENGVIHWSNLSDGDGGSGGAITADNLARITALVNAEGNIIVSGSGVAEALVGSPALATTLRVAAVQPNIGVSSIQPTGAIADVSVLSTAQNTSNNTVAFATTANDGLVPTSGTGILAEYVGVPANTAVAGVAYNEALVFLGFAYESVGSAAGSNDSKLLRQQLMAALLRYLTGETAARDWQLFD